LVGPVAAVGLYELPWMCCIRRHWAPSSRWAFLLMAIFLIWLVVAEALYIAIFGYSAPASIVLRAMRVRPRDAGSG